MKPGEIEIPPLRPENDLPSEYVGNATTNQLILNNAFVKGRSQLSIEEFENRLQQAVSFSRSDSRCRVSMIVSFMLNNRLQSVFDIAKKFDPEYQRLVSVLNDAREPHEVHQRTRRARDLRYGRLCNDIIKAINPAWLEMCNRS